jgi:hypothetical protein
MANLIEALNVYNVFSPKMRIGNNSDGGYIINETLSEVTTKLISIGMGLEDSFEREWFRRFKTPIEAYDGTYVCQTLCSEFSENVNKDIFYVKQNVGYQQENIPINVILDKKSNVLLKVDVEGAEYNIFDNVALNSNVVGVLLEVHDLYKKENRDKLIDLVQNKFSDFLLFHIHGNVWGSTFTLNLSKTGNTGLEIPNFPITLELSFINKRLLANYELETQPFPVPGLDFSNNSEKPDINLPWVNAL